MSSPPPFFTEILVVGAGVLGLCVAAELTRRGHEVRVLDAGGPNASSVAAGMIAPALESAIDDVTPERAALFRQARVMWDDFAAQFGLDLIPGPAIWRGEGAEEISGRLTTLGFEAVATTGGLSVPFDGFVEPVPALARLKAGLTSVLVGRAEAISREGDGWRVQAAGLDIRARTLVLATGAAVEPEGLPPTVAALLALIQPIRGQIGRSTMPVSTVTRSRDVYLAPSGHGSVIGATMEPGRRDLAPDPSAGARLHQAAGRLVADAETAPVEWRVGIRGATPDGLPMAGPSGEPGLHLALAPRRNGWLLGPLVARVVADGIEGQGMSPGLLDPRRFA